MRHKLLIVITVLLGSLAATHAVAKASQEDTSRVKGQIVAVRQSEATENQGALTEIKVRTREQEQFWLRLGRSEEMGNRFQVGDSVKARCRATKGDAPMEVFSLKNRSNGESFTLRSEDGTLLQQQDRDRDRARDGSGARDRDRDRDRVHQPGAGQGSAGGSGQGGGPGGGPGGGSGGQGGGGGQGPGGGSGGHGPHGGRPSA